MSASDEFADFDLAALKLALLDPADIADVFWDLNAKRDRAEAVVGGF